MKIRNAIFDMDGTIVSSGETIYEATVYTLKLFGINNEMPYDKFSSYIGLHFGDLLPYFDIHIDDMEGFIDEFKSHYFEFIQYSHLYPDVVETFDALKEMGIKISMLTTKGQDQTDKILKHFNLAHYFDYVMGRRPGIGHKPSPEPLFIICKELNILPKESIMVGDSELDVKCGKSAGAKTAAVTYGYRQKSSLIPEEPDFIIDNLISLKYILSESNS